MNLQITDDDEARGQFLIPTVLLILNSHGTAGTVDWGATASPALDRLWIGDVTYIPTWQGWLCLAVLLATYPRRVIGWTMADHLRTEFTLPALRMALTNRRPDR